MSFVDDYNPNVQDLSESIFLGPQGELLEHLERFNHTYQCDLAVTNKFYWKPGTYDKIRNIITKTLRIEAKANSLLKVVDRVRESDYLIRNLRESIKQLDDKILLLRQDGIVWQDNTDNVEMCINTIKERIQTQSEAIPDIGVDISVELDPIAESDYSDANDYRYDRVIIVARLKNPEISLTSGSDPCRVVGSIPYQGELEIKFRMNLLKSINFWAGRDEFTPLMPRGMSWHHWSQSGRSRNTDALTIVAYNKPDMIGLSHPYIQRINHSHGVTSISIDSVDDNAPFLEGKGVCMGDLGNDIMKAAWSYNLTDLATLVKLWLTSYHLTRTNPLNNIHSTYYGKPSYLSKEFTNIIGVIASPNQCMLPNQTSENEYRPWHYTSKFATKHCESINCALMDECSFYQMSTDEDVGHKWDQLLVEYYILDLKMGHWEGSFSLDDFNPEDIGSYYDQLASEGDINGDDDPNQWNYDRLYAEVQDAIDNLEWKKRLSKEYAQLTGSSSSKMKELWHKYNAPWFSREIEELKADEDSDPFDQMLTQDEEEIKEQMIRWAAERGGVR